MGLSRETVEVVSEALQSAGSSCRSPLVLAGIMLNILRTRFNPEAGSKLPFKWIPVPGDQDTESPASTIRIEAGGQSLVGKGYTKPGIYVVRQPTHFQQMSVASVMHRSLVTGDSAYIALGTTGFTIVCEADDEGVSSILGDLVLSTFMQSQKIMEKLFNLHTIGPFSMSATSSTRKDKEIFETHVSVGMSYQVQWANLSLTPLFNEVVVRSKDNVNLFMESYTKSLLSFNTEA